ncbi:hypothetical protein [Mesorhizobium sp. CC13]
MAQVDEIWLRAWVNEGIITPEQFEAEMRRRRLAATPTEAAADDEPLPE